MSGVCRREIHARVLRRRLIAPFGSPVGTRAIVGGWDVQVWIPYLRAVPNTIKCVIIGSVVN